MKKIGFSKSVRKTILITTAVISIYAVGSINYAIASDKLLPIQKEQPVYSGADSVISQRGFRSAVNGTFAPSLDRAKPWSLPSSALSPQADTTINILVLRFNFKYEDIDDPNSTGLGHMNLSPHPVLDTGNINTPEDTAYSEAYFDTVGHFIDPPPHDSAYFDAHLRALRRYWLAVSEEKLNLTWDIYPPGRDSVYELPYEMAHYGNCAPYRDSIIAGLERFFLGGVRLADAESPEIVFSNYQSIILFHAGSDRQNDIGFPPTCADLFTGFIILHPDSMLVVDNNSFRIRTGLMMPETSSQDNRATALNAVLAHEFGHQLGLVDLYNTSTFMTQLGDFALMDNNGFGTGIDFQGFTIGRVFGGIPLYPMAWSRAFLGFVPVHDYQQGTDIGIVAAEMSSNDSVKIARIPISETQYYLIENRQVDIDGIETNVGADYTTNVIQGPAWKDTLAEPDSLVYTREYDHLMPDPDKIGCGGLAVFLVDEEVAAMKDSEGITNFARNQLQLDKNRRFISLVEADGLVNFGGNYRLGYGKPEDLFRDDRTTEFTPFTNPSTTDNLGNDTRIYITNIMRDTVTPPGYPVVQHIDSLISFDLTRDKQTLGFPIRSGLPVFPLSPVAADLDGEGNDEILVPAGNILSIVTSQGESFLEYRSGCVSCPGYTDNVGSSVNPRGEPVPIFAQLPQVITAGPVVGHSSWSGSSSVIAVGYPTANEPPRGALAMFTLDDIDTDGRADTLTAPITTEGFPIALSFGNRFYALTSTGRIYRSDSLGDVGQWLDLDHTDYHGLCRLGNKLVVLSEEESTTWLNLVDDTIHSYDMGGMFTLGPVAADLDRDGIIEIVTFSENGEAMIVSVDPLTMTPTFDIYLSTATGWMMTTNPVVGDIDRDGRPDIVIGGENELLAFNNELTLITEFPIAISDRFPGDFPAAAPVLADIDLDEIPDVIVPSALGSVHSFGPGKTLGFPLPAPALKLGTDTLLVGSPVLFSDSSGGSIGYLAADGWFYAWETDFDSASSQWPMAGHDASGSFYIDVEDFGDPVVSQTRFPSERFYSWPNPVLDGQANIRYFLGEDASRVSLRFYDLSGSEVFAKDTVGSGGIDNEWVWNCGNITPGVYRCVIEVDFGDGTVHDFTDIAIIR